MANTATGTVSFTTAKTPDGFTAPVVAALTNPARENFVRDVARTTVENASAATGLTNLIASMKTWLEGTFLPGFGVDAATARFVITAVTPTLSAAEPNDYKNIYATSTANLRVHGYVEWILTP